ncbi:MAG: putative Sensor protein yycG [Deltaproteobacteria bacterium]|nr:putative Sensor protein yycG [Deltaproteobacteria bacterium]
MKRLWNNSLAAKVFLSYLIVVALLFTGFYFSSSATLRKFYLDWLSGRMEREAQLIARVLPFDVQGNSLDTQCRQLTQELGLRVTVIALDGRVLCDSAEASVKMENHGLRPEVVEALKTGSGSSIRYSTTVGYDLLYRAFRHGSSGQDRIVRVATPLKDIEAAVQSFRVALLTGLFVAAGVGLLLAWLFSRYLSRRFKPLVLFSDQVARGQFPQGILQFRNSDEIALLERHLNDMSLKIRDNLQQITGEKEKADSILRCMIEGVLVLDPKGQVLVINDQAKAMFHVAEGRDLQGVSMLEISRHPEVHKILEEVLAFDFSARRYSKEVELAEERWFRVNAVRLCDSAGHRLGSILVFHDITDIKRFESMRSDFVANVSHELRTPLTAIRGYVETLLHTPPTDPQDSTQFLEIIERHSERLSRLTEDLLTLSDLESGKIQLSLQPLDVSQLIQRVFEVFRDQAIKKGVTLTQRLEPGLARLLGDLDRLQQLFINLVDNAVKYTPSGGEVSLTASLITAQNGAGQIEITVADTGPGISERDLPRLTERFYRVDKARSRHLGGTGLGLAIVKHIVQAHRGELEIDSLINKGTTVRIRLPIAPSDPAHQSILFLCTGNSCRSQMAEGFARSMVANRDRVYSAGTSPKGIHPLAIRVMGEVGIDISTQHSKGLDEIPLGQIDQLITLCGDAAKTCPTLPAKVARTHWPLPDPALATGDEEEVMKVFRQVRDDIRARVQALYSSSHHQAAQPTSFVTLP